MSRLANNRLGGFSAGKSSSAYDQGSNENLGSASKNSKETRLSSHGTVISPSDCVPKRFAVKYDPPTIVMEYLVPSSGKLYHHKMKVNNLESNSNTSDILDELKDNHYQYFATNKISDVQMNSFIERLKKNLQENSKSGASSKAEVLKESQGGSGLMGKLTSLNTSAPAKQNHDRGFPLVSSDLNQNKATPTSKGLTGKDTSTTKKKEASNGFWEFDELEDLSDNGDEGESGSQPGSQVFDYHHLNLNKLSSEEVQKHKNKMEVLFSKNQKKPGEEGFEYDRQEEFSPVDAHEWDDEF
jgi:centrosomal protein CEP19